MTENKRKTLLAEYHYEENFAVQYFLYCGIPAAALILRTTRTLYFLVQCSCQVFLRKNLLLISITVIRREYDKTTGCVYPIRLITSD